MTLGEKLRQIREEKGLTQKQLGDLCKPPMADSAIRRYEIGNANPKIETIERIASALNVGIEVFMSDSELSLFESMTNLYINGKKPILEIDDIASSAQENYLISQYRELNEIGQKKANDYIEDLVQIPEYRKM